MTYNCPNCHKELYYSSGDDVVECPYCSQRFALKGLKPSTEQNDANINDANVELSPSEIEKIKEEARAEGRAQAAKAQIKGGCAAVLIAFAVGAIIGGIVGNAVAGGAGVLWGAWIGGGIGVWLFL